MKKTTKSLLITSLILFCTGLLLALGSALFVKIKGIDPYGVEHGTKVIEDKNLSLSQLLADSPESNYVKKLSNKEFLRMDLTSFTGNLIVQAADETSVELKSTNTENLSCSIIGETLTITEIDAVGIMGLYIDEEGFSFKGLRHIFGPGNSANTKKTVIVNVARDYSIDQLDINSKIGSITIDGVLAKTMNISSTAGSVKIQNLASPDGKINIKSDSSDIQLKNCVYNSLSVSTKTGDIDMNISDLNALSTVLEVWTGDIQVVTDIPTSQYKLALSTTVGKITRNNTDLGKDFKDSSSNANRITASAIIGDISLSFSGGDESLYVAVDTEPKTEPTTEAAPNDTGTAV